MKKISIYITAGLYSKERTLEIALSLKENGVDFLELGMPYSDPIADGPVIQESSKRAIDKGITLEGYFELAELLVSNGIEIVFMGYFNQILKFGEDRFYSQCERLGIQKMIVPALPLGYYKGKVEPKALKKGIKLCPLITPTTSENRIKEMDSMDVGFIYIVADNSITGSTSSAKINQAEYLSRIQQSISNPTMLGFGIRDAETASMGKYTYGIIIGSAFLKQWMEDESG